MNWLPRIFFNLFPALLFCCANVNAQQVNYYVRHLTNENGLPQNSIKGIETDREGYLWLATEMGIARYDGDQFRLYDQTNTRQLKVDRMISMGLLADSSIYVESDEYRYYRIRQNQTLVPYFPDEKTRKLLDSFSIFNAFDIHERCKSLAYQNPSLQWILPDAHSIARSLLNSLKYIYGRYYYFNENGQLVSVDPELKSFRKEEIVGPLASAMTRFDRLTVPVSLLSYNQELYVRYGDWIYYLDTKNHNGNIESNNVLQVGDIPNISCFKIWPQANVFLVGTLSDGLYIFQKHFFSTLRFKDIESNVFYSQTPFGHDGVLTKKGVLSPTTVLPLSVPAVTSESILQTNEGHYFVNTWKSKDESGIVELDSKLNMIRYIPALDLRVSCFRQLKNGTIWISRDSYFMGKIENRHISYIERPAGLPDNFSVSTFIQTSDDELWIAGNRGLAKMDTSASHVLIIPELSDIHIRTLYQDKKGTIWIGSYGKGYYAWYKNHLVHMPADKNNYLAAAHSFLEDRKGYLWITTNIGLFQASITDLYNYLDSAGSSVYYHYYDQTSGFLTNEFNGGCTPSGVELGNGTFSFPSMKSLVQFNPDSITPILPKGPIYVDAIIADTTHIDYETDSVSFSQNIHRIRFFISSPYFGNAYNQEIEYQISELDKNWYPVDDDGIIKINKPGTGHYELLLRKKSGFGRNNYITKKVSFFIQPAFFETWIFKALLFLLFFGLAYLFFRIRIRFLLQQKERLEKEVSERTKEQGLLIESLENTITELEDSREELYQNNLFKEKLAMIITHDLQSPLRFLHDATRRLHNRTVQKRSVEVYRQQYGIGKGY